MLLIGGVAEDAKACRGWSVALAVCEPKIELPDLFNPADTWDAGQNDDVRPAPRTNARVNRARATSKTNTC